MTPILPDPTGHLAKARAHFLSRLAEPRPLRTGDPVFSVQLLQPGTVVHISHDRCTILACGRWHVVHCDTLVHRHPFAHGGLS